MKIEEKVIYKVEDRSFTTEAAANKFIEEQTNERSAYQHNSDLLEAAKETDPFVLIRKSDKEDAKWDIIDTNRLHSDTLLSDYQFKYFKENIVISDDFEGFLSDCVSEIVYVRNLNGILSALSYFGKKYGVSAERILEFVSELQFEAEIEYD